MTSANGPVAVERNLLVPLSDGVELAADLYRPEAGGPWPAILTFIPYLHAHLPCVMITAPGMHRGRSAGGPR